MQLKYQYGDEFYLGAYASRERGSAYFGPKTSSANPQLSVMGHFDDVSVLSEVFPEDPAGNDSPLWVNRDRSIFAGVRCGSESGRLRHDAKGQ
jgi:hypothetical protein